MKFLYNFLYISLIVLLIASCKDEDPVIENPEELITTLNFILSPQGGGQTVTFSFQDLDGDGGNAPVITNGTLTANTSYSGTIELLNEAVNPAEDITTEVNAEDTEHQLFYQTGGLPLTINYDDQDAIGLPLGLQTTVISGAAGAGTLTITLRHEPVKSAAGVAEGQIANAGGETDVEVTFDVVIQ